MSIITMIRDLDPVVAMITRGASMKAECRAIVHKEFESTSAIVDMQVTAMGVTASYVLYGCTIRDDSNFESDVDGVIKKYGMIDHALRNLRHQIPMTGARQ